jgi:hypothetical protein
VSRPFQSGGHGCEAGRAAAHPAEQDKVQGSARRR